MDTNQQPEILSIPEVTTSSPKSRLPLILLGIFLLLLFGVGSFYLGQRSQTANYQIVPTIPILSTTQFKPSPTPDVYTEPSRSETTNWKTYKNTQYQYSIDYPDNWEVQQVLYNYEKSPPSGFTTVPKEKNELQRTILIEKNPKLYQGTFTVIVFANSKNLTLDKWAQNYKVPLTADPNTNLAKVVGETTLDGKTAKEISINTLTVPGEIAIISLYNNNIYYLMFDDWEKQEPTVITKYDAEKLIQANKKILSTFTFLDKNKTSLCNCSFVISSISNVEFLVTSPSGQQTGYVQGNKYPLLNIPSSSYGVQPGISDDTGESPPLPDSVQFGTSEGENGIYNVQIFPKQ